MAVVVNGELNNVLPNVLETLGGVVNVLLENSGGGGGGVGMIGAGAAGRGAL